MGARIFAKMKPISWIRDQPIGYEMGYFDQMPGIATYTVVLLGFPLENSNVEEVKNQLRSATDTMTKAFPWMRGTVQLTVPEGEEATNSGTYWLSTETARGHENEVLRFKDVSAELPSYSDMLKSKAPMTSIPGDLLAPQKGLPASVNPTKDNAPALDIQANFVNGGVLLCFASEHNVTDMNGQGQIIRLFSQALRVEPFTKQQLEIGNVDRRAFLPRLKDGEKPLEFPHVMGPSKLGKDVWGSEPVDASWKMVRFTFDKSKTLKELASKKAYDATVNGTTSAAPEWISTNDALMAFMWQRITAARSGKFDKSEKAVMVRAVNSRKRLQPQIPEEYMGHAVCCTSNGFPIEEMAKHENIARIAAGLRQSLYEADDYTVRSFIDLISKEKDKSKFDYTTPMTWPKDLIASSWAELRLSTTAFGSLGMPDFVRRPNFDPFPSCIYITDKTKNGDYDVAISLASDDWTELEKDEVWNTYAEMIG